MKIEDLIERLQDIAEFHPGADVVLAVQPGYPIRESLRGVAGPGDAPHADEDEDDVLADPDTVWLVSGGQSHRHDVSPYAPGWVFEECY